MGGKNSGRYKRGAKKLGKKILSQVSSPRDTKEEPYPAPKIEMVTEPVETMDFESNADRILRESLAQTQVENQKVQEEKQKASPDAENIQTEQIKKKEDWSPVIGFVMHALGSFFKNTTGFEELDYTKEEVKDCSEAGSDLLNVFFPDMTALTEDQKVILFSSMVILKVHVDKFALYQKLKKENDEKNETTARKPTESAA